MRNTYPRSLFIVILAGLLFPTAIIAGPQASFLAPLTPLEIKVLNNTKSTRSGDADALLAMALITSGDIRQQRSFDAIRMQIQKFIRHIRPTIANQPSVYAKGEKLLKAMHDHYFTAKINGGDSDLVDGYDAEQSSVSAIFQNGRFNCVSSAILYIVLARYFDLDVQGVVTTQHVFVQINKQNGRAIEVETTSKNGYGLIHDKRFYNQRFAAFSRSRNLAMPTYKDYLNRRVLSPFMLIVNNMNNQHTHATRMSKTTRNRLFEIQGYLDSGTAASQINRLGVYQNSMITLLNDRNSRKAFALLRTIEPVVAQIKTHPWINDSQNRHVRVIWDRLGAIHTLWGHLLLADKQYKTAEQQYAEALQWAKSTSRQTQAKKGIFKARAFKAFDDQKWNLAIKAYKDLLSQAETSDKKLVRQTRANIVAAYWNWGNAAENRSNWKEAAAHYETIRHWADRDEALKKAQEAKVHAYAMHHFKNRRWAKAIHHFKKTLTYQDPKQQAATHHSIGSAFINWGNALFHDDKYQLALEKYEAAMSKAKKDRRKIIHNNVMAVYRSLTANLLKQKKYNEAITLVKPSTKRFPNCTPCMREIQRLSRLAKTQRKP